jgi:predicted HTH domain antitoxin
MSTAGSTITIDCPSEVLLELHVSEEELATLLKETVAIELFRKGRLSSGLAARWAGQERMPFLLKAMEQGAVLLDEGEVDFRRETSLL